MHRDCAAALIAALTDAKLREVSSSAVFQRGQAYASSGAVDITSEEAAHAPAIDAVVAGTQPYSTQVWVRAGAVTGACDCANAEDGWFCKHQVALALVWRDRLGGHAPGRDEPDRTTAPLDRESVRTAQDPQQVLVEFLRSQSATALADRLMDFAQRDHEIERELQQWRKLSAAPKSLAEIEALITEIMSAGRDLISWRESGDYANRAAAVLPLLDSARARDPAGAAALCLHALREGWAVLDQSDDSDGEIGGLIHSIGAAWIQAVRQAGPLAADFGDTYLQLVLDDPVGSIDSEAAQDAMGAAALGRYRSALARRWRAAKDAVLAERARHAQQTARALAQRKRPPSAPPDTAHGMRLWTLQRMHLAQLEAQGDLDGALAVMREDMTRPGDYHEVTAFLEQHGRLQEAFENAQLGFNAFADDWRIQEDLLRCLDREGRVEDAFALRRRRFEREPSVQRYHEALESGAAAARDATVLRTELHAVLAACEEQAASRHGTRSDHRGQRGIAGGAPRDVTLRVEVLCSEDRWAEALALVRPPARCRDDVLASLARRLGPEHAELRIELLTKVFASAMQRSKTPYRMELALVKEIAKLLDWPRRSAWLLKLQVEYKAKRNFIRDLPLK